MYKTIRAGGLEDTDLAQIEDVSPFSSTWEGSLEYSRQHLASRRGKRTTYELSFSKTFETVRLKMVLKEEETCFL